MKLKRTYMEDYVTLSYNKKIRPKLTYYNQTVK